MTLVYRPDFYDVPDWTVTDVLRYWPDSSVSIDAGLGYPIRVLADRLWV